MILGDMCTIRSGMTLRSRLAEAPDGLLTVQQGDISPRGEFDRENASRMSTPASSSHLVAPGELVVRSRGPFWSAWAPSDLDEPVAAIAPLFILTPAPDIDPAYLAWFIGRPAAQRYFATESMGTSVKMIPRDVLGRLPITAPPIEQQRTIATAAALSEHEHRLSARLSDLRHTLNSAHLDQYSRRAAAASDTDRTTR
ncbi:hypothetical protein [Microbacterium sp. NPDC057944]|uniref:hypothetical protein n=1 Tax=Microbacterium sp. NPDC057944 TaxID=3346286 RepID=UPI0036DF6C1D